jgi:cyclopropane-fatty-acyl-phospholipid synthase
MASQRDIEATYNYMDEVFRLYLGDFGDISCALYNGDPTMTLEAAQRAKHSWILDGIRFSAGQRILDIGCGWGPMLHAIRARGGIGLGLTLSSAQASACRAAGFDVLVKDCKTATVDELGTFDGVACVGALEHLCSKEEFLQGKQDAIYDRFFAFCASVLPPRGRLFVQCMTWGKTVPPVSGIDVNAPKFSDAWLLGHVEKIYPGSWPANGLEHVQRCAAPYFNFVSENNGRRDYIRTMHAWGDARRRAPRATKLRLMAKLLPLYATDREFRYKVASLRNACNRLCFERELMSHQRIFFEKRA